MIVKRVIDGLEALATIAEPLPEKFEGSSYLASRQKVGAWAGVSFEEALVLARHGWPEGAAKARKLLEKLEVPMLTSVTSETVYDVTGSYVDVGEYVQGVPECMVDFKEDKRRARFASILVSGVVGSNIDPGELINRGVCIAALVDTLERSNVRCEVSLVFLNNLSGSVLEYTVVLKQAHDPLNLDVLTFGVAHPSCFRRLVFGAYEHESTAVRSAIGIHQDGGYGRVVPVPQEEGTIVFQSPVYGQDWSPTAALKRINDTITKFGGAQ